MAAKVRLEYEVGIVGHKNVARELDSIERRFMRQYTYRVNVATKAAGAAAGRTAARNTDAISSSVSKAMREQERAEAFVASVRRRHFQQIQREERAAEAKSAKERERAEAHVASVRRRHFAQVQREEQASERRLASKTAREAQALRQSRKATIGALGSSVRSSVGGMASFVGGAVAVGAGFTAGDAVQRQIGLGRRYTDLVVQSQAPGSEYDPKKRERVRSTVEALAVGRGIDREDLTGALEMGVQKTGDLDKSMENLEQFAVLGQAFKTSTTEMAAAASVLQDRFGLSATEIADTMATLGSQGRKASFELADMATLVERLAASASRFDFKGAEGARTLGGLAQIARSQTGSAEQASTAVDATLRQLISKSKDIQSGKAFGKKVEVFEGGDAKNQARDVRSVIEDAISASQGDKVKLQSTFVEGMSTLNPMISAYSEASRAAGGGKKGDAAGRAAIQQVFADAIDATGTYADAQKDAATIAADESSKLVKAQEEVAIALADLSPVVVELAGTLAANKETIKKVADAFVSFAKFMVENPLKGIGAIIAAKVTADIATAAIGSKIQNAILALLGKAPVPVPGTVPGATPLAGSPLAQFAPLAAVPAVAALSVYDDKARAARIAAGDQASGGTQSAIDAARQASLQRVGAGPIEAGKFDDERVRLGGAVEAEKGRESAARKRGLLQIMAGMPGAGIGMDAGTAQEQVGARRNRKEAERLQAELGPAQVKGMDTAAQALLRAAQALEKSAKEQPNRSPSPTVPRR